jgi:hypothetical protein
MRHLYTVLQSKFPAAYMQQGCTLDMLATGSFGGALETFCSAGILNLVGVVKEWLVLLVTW